MLTLDPPSVTGSVGMASKRLRDHVDHSFGKGRNGTRLCLNVATHFPSEFSRQRKCEEERRLCTCR